MQNQSNTEQFLKLPYDLLAANSFVSSSTGEIVEISLQQKIIYCWMKQRCEFFTREKKEYYDALDSVADELTINRKTVMAAVALFIKHNVLFAEKRKAPGAREKWFFKHFNNLELVQSDKPSQKASTSPVVKRSEQVDSQVAPTPKQPIKAVEKAVEEGEMDDIEYTIALADSTQQPKVLAPVEQKPVCPFATAPVQAFDKSGQATEEMIVWCDKNGVAIRGLDGRTVFKLKGINYTKTKEGYKEYTPAPYKSSSPKTLAEDCGMEHMLNQFYNDEIDVPF